MLKKLIERFHFSIIQIYQKKVHFKHFLMMYNNLGVVSNFFYAFEAQRFVVFPKKKENLPGKN